MMNIVMLVKDRPNLTVQSLATLYKNTAGDFNLTIIDDGSKAETRDTLLVYARSMNGKGPKVAVLRNETSKGITGQARNLGVYWSEKYFGRGDWLYLSDNDVFFMPQWDADLCAAYDAALKWNLGFELLGGQNHPYHKPVAIFDYKPLEDDVECQVRQYEAVAGTSWLMRWSTWDTYGPLDAVAPGVCQGEDGAFGDAIKKAGGKVGAIWPHVVLDTGITQTNGTPSVGSSEKERVPGVVYE